MRRWAESASAHRDPSPLSSDVDPSMSLNRNVNVPVGNGPMTTQIPPRDATPVARGSRRSLCRMPFTGRALRLS